MKKLFITGLLLITQSTFANVSSAKVFCTAALQSGNVIDITSCVDMEKQRFVPCDSGGVAYITIRLEQWKDAYRSAPVAMQVEIPERLVTNNSAEEHFGLSIDDISVGKMELMFAYDQRSGTNLSINLKAIKARSSDLKCEFSNIPAEAYIK